MCGRFAITLPPEALRRLFDYEEMPNFPPRFNIAPTQPIPIIRADGQDGRRHFALARWAFLPGFVKDPKSFASIFNARAESLDNKPSFRNAYRRRRCIVPADAFYEWHRRGPRTGLSQPYLGRRTDGQTLALAALWETWQGPNGEEVDTACIITTAANRYSEAIHSRLPAIIEAADLATWLDPDERRADTAVALLTPTADETLTFVPIGDAVNKAAHDAPEVQTPIGPPLARTKACFRPGEDQPQLF